MKSARADALRLILPLLPRLATVDFFGTDDLCRCVELFGFDEVLFAEDRDKDDRDRPLFWATTVNGRTSMTVASATPMRLSIRNLLSTRRLSGVKEDKARKSWTRWRLQLNPTEKKTSASQLLS